METAHLLAQLVRFGFKTIAFCKVRKVCEIVLERAQEMLRKSKWKRDRECIGRMKSYRAGYQLEQRRRIEKELFGGRLSGVVATSALELGIDVGSLDASLHLGFPGSVSSFFQQAGRCGRGKADSLTILVGYGSPLDQYVVQNPESTVFGKAFPSAVVDPENPFILKKHVLCASFEDPIRLSRDALYFGGMLPGVVQDMEEKGWLRRFHLPGGAASGAAGQEPLFRCNAAVRWEKELRQAHASQHQKNNFRGAYNHPLPGSGPLTSATPADSRASDASLGSLPGRAGASRAEEAEARANIQDVALEQVRSPAFDVALRNINEKEYQVIFKDTGEVIDHVDEGRAFFEVYPGATYLQQGLRYVVTYLDIHDLVAYVERCDPPYYTSQADHREVTVTHIFPPAKTGAWLPDGARGDTKTTTAVRARHGRVMVTTSVFAYHKISLKTGNVLETVPLHLPPIQMQTKAFWVDIPPWVQLECRKRERDFKGGVHGAAHVLAAVTPLRLLCDRHADLATECPNVKENVRRPSRILVYESQKGGLGVSMMGSLIMPELISLAVSVVKSCPCANEDGLGCPECIQSTSCPEYNEVLDKEAALLILECMKKILTSNS